MFLKNENIERLVKDYEDDLYSDSTIEDISSMDENGENNDEKKMMDFKWIHFNI